MTPEIHRAQQRFLDLAGSVEDDGLNSKDVVIAMVMAAMDATTQATSCSTEQAKAILIDLISRAYQPDVN